MITRAAFKITPEEREHTLLRLIKNSYPGSNFYIMLIASVIIATAGLILNNTAVIIGSMLVAPFLSPILSLSLGIVLADFDIIHRSLVIIGKSALTTLVVATLFAAFLLVPYGYNTEILSRVSPSLPYLYIAIAAGVAAAFAIAKPSLSEFIVGVAVSVAILPPLAVSGVGISQLDPLVGIGALQLFVVNLVGIVFAGVIVFSLMGFYPSRSKAEKVIKAEERKLKAEQHIADAKR
ncbi:MAG: TIGR00341 family protein [Patescibacteria group bacterium]|nr:TIGR00341 family protein [Patescibacteria group bacterium]